MPRTIKLPIGEIVIQLGENGGGSIKSNLKDYEDEDADDYNSAIDGIESLILAHACAGVDVTAKAYVEGLETALDALGNNL
jgi:hypothetical protein